MSTPDEDFSKRRLCPDGSCLGVLGEDDRCPECGRIVAPPDGRPEATGAAAEPDGSPEATAAPEPAGGFDSERRLCEDGACLGLIGADGACNVCGRCAQTA